MEHDHSAEDIRLRLQRGPDQSYLRDWIYGGIDGAVTTFAIVSGVVGGKLSYDVVLILGVANLLADGFSMAASNYSGTSSEHEEHDRIRDMELRHIRDVPEGEREEVRQIYAAKGFEGDDLESVVRVITSDRERWLQTMLTEEHGLPATLRSPLRAAWNTFAAFVICGVVPLLPFMITIPHAFLWSIILTGVTFFLIGSLRSRWTLGKWWVAGSETLAIGAAAAVIAYGIGAVLERMLAG